MSAKLKKKLFLFAGVVILIGASCLFYLHAVHPNMNGEDCPFCNPKVLSAQTFYEEDLVLALYAHKPVFPGHCLIVPKRHVQRFESVSEQELAQIMAVVKKVDRAVADAFSSSSYLLLQKNGVEVGQSVPHVHFHYIPRKAGDTSIFKLILRILFAPFHHPIPTDEMNRVVIQLQKVV